MDTKGHCWCLSRKSFGVVAYMITSSEALIQEFARLDLEVICSTYVETGLLSQMIIQESLQERIKEAKKFDDEYKRLID